MKFFILSNRFGVTAGFINLLHFSSRKQAVTYLAAKRRGSETVVRIKKTHMTKNIARKIPHGKALVKFFFQTTVSELQSF